MNDTDRKVPTTISRDDLYNQVWATPMHRLGRQYGISGNGLKKICNRLNVPYPPRGYWAKLSAGKRVKQTPLPRAHAGTPTEVTITPTQPAAAPVRTPEIDPEIAGQLNVASTEASGIAVPAILRHAHWAIAAWINRHERDLAAAKRDRLLWGREFGPKPFTPLERRQQRFLSTLLKEAEKRSYQVNGEAPHRLSLQIGRNTVEFSLHEHIRQVRRLLTHEEKAKAYSSRQRWRQERIPTGQLIFALKTFLVPGLSKEWRDGERPLEDQIGEIIAVLTVAGPILERRRLDAEAAERRRWQEETRRREEHDRQIQDRNRWRRFIELAKQWKDAQLAGCFLEELKKDSHNPEAQPGRRTHSEWISWAGERRDAFDPARWSAGEIWEDLESVTSRAIRTTVSVQQRSVRPSSNFADSAFHPITAVIGIFSALLCFGDLAWRRECPPTRCNSIGQSIPCDWTMLLPTNTPARQRGFQRSIANTREAWLRSLC